MCEETFGQFLVVVDLALQIIRRQRNTNALHLVKQGGAL
jgi:hypothetical protein